MDHEEECELMEGDGKDEKGNEYRVDDEEFELMEGDGKDEKGNEDGVDCKKR